MQNTLPQNPASATAAQCHLLYFPTCAQTGHRAGAIRIPGLFSIVVMGSKRQQIATLSELRSAICDEIRAIEALPADQEVW